MKSVEFEQLITEGKLGSVYVFQGPEEWTKQHALQVLRETVLPLGLEQLNENTLENPTVRQLADCADTVPVMCDKRIVVVRDPLLLLPKGRTSEDANADTSDKKTGKGVGKEADQLYTYLAAAPETTVIIFRLPSETSVSASVKKKLDAAGVVFVDFDRLFGKELLNWCGAQLKPMKKKITAEAVNEMVEMAGQDLAKLETELRKLAAYVEDRQTIGIEDIHAVVTPTPEYVVFTLLDHIMHGDLKSATLTAEAAIADSGTPVGLISLISGQLRNDLHIRLGTDAGRSDTEIAKSLDFKNPGRVYFIKKQIAGHSARTLKQAFCLCVDANSNCTAGRLKGDAALNALIPALCTLFSEGKKK